MTQVKWWGTKWVGERRSSGNTFRRKERSRLHLERDVFTQQISHHYRSLLLSGEGGTDWQAEQEGGKERANHLHVCQVKEVLTGSMRRKEIRAESGLKRKKWWGETHKVRDKTGGGGEGGFSVRCVTDSLTDVTKERQWALPPRYSSQIGRVRKNV